MARLEVRQLVGIFLAIGLILGMVVFATMRPAVEPPEEFQSLGPTPIWSSGDPIPTPPPVPKVVVSCGSLVRPGSEVFPVNYEDDGQCAARRRQLVKIELGLSVALVVVLVTLFRPRRERDEVGSEYIVQDIPKI